MVARYARETLSDGAPTPLLWVPAWLVGLIGGAIVLAGLAYFARRAEQRRAKSRARRAASRRPPGSRP